MTSVIPDPIFMQTILGANGAIATQLSKHFPGYTMQIRQVSRNPKKINTTVSGNFNEQTEPKMTETNEVKKTTGKMKLIAIEEHFLTSEVRNAWKKIADDDDPTNKLHF